MKIHVAYDQEGNITALAVPAPDYIGRIGIKPKDGDQVIEVDEPSAENEQGNELLGIRSEQEAELLRKLYEEYRVDVNSDNPTLVKK